MKTRLLLCIAVSSSALLAGPRSSLNYEIAADSADAGGQHATSANFTHDGCLAGVTGVSTLVIPVTAAKHGFLGQVAERSGLLLTSTASTVNEGDSLQLAAWQTLDDDSLLIVPAGSVTWSVQSGPLAGINASGLASAATVYQDGAAVAHGEFRGDSASLALTIVNLGADDFGDYAGDGLADAWQVFHFGENNPGARPDADPDGDGQSNRFEFIAGLTPTDAQSVFRLQVSAVDGLPSQRKLVFSPRFDDRNYQVQFRPSLTTGAWEPLLDATQSDDNLERTVTDSSATGATRFYRVEITQP